MANDVLAHDRDPGSDVVAESEGEAGRQAQPQISPIAIPGAITRIDAQVTALNQRVDQVLALILPDPEEADRRELVELRHKNKELEISLYVLCGLFFLLFLMGRR